MLPNAQTDASEREYVVVNLKCVWGKPGDTVTLHVTDAQELSLLQAGTVKLPEARPSTAGKKG